MQIKTKNGIIFAIRNNDHWDLYKDDVKFAECYTRLKAPSKEFLLDNAISPLNIKLNVQYKK